MPYIASSQAERTINTDGMLDAGPASGDIIMIIIPAFSAYVDNTHVKRRIGTGWIGVDVWGKGFCGIGVGVGRCGQPGGGRG